jgi:hypothetical protein
LWSAFAGLQELLAPGDLLRVEEVAHELRGLVLLLLNELTLNDGDNADVLL